MSLRKQYFKAKPLCKVTFSLPSQVARLVNAAHPVGDFNGWNVNATPMKRLKNGTFTATLILHRDTEYQFRYLLDAHRWENDWKADKYVPNPYGSDNSVVVV